MEALDFQVDVGGGADGYAVTVRAPDGAEAISAIALPLAGPDVEGRLGRIQDALLASSASVRRSLSREEQPVQAFGRMLFDALFAGDARGLLVASRQRAAREGKQLRLVLRVRPSELARLPWEFLFDAAEDDYVSLHTPVIRYPPVLAPEQPLQVAAPLRVLGMVARPSDQRTLAVDDEQRRLHEALDDLQHAGRVQLDWVPGQTWRALKAAMRRGPWHVLHFIGHGGFDAAAGEGTLALADDHGRTYHLRAGDLAMLLRGHRSLRLVVLNACDTGRASALDPFSSVAGALMRRGIPAVLAMQFEITDPAAIEFSRTFYDGLTSQLPIDVSVTDARQAIRLAIPGTLEWGTPVLYLRSPDGYLFDLADAPSIAAAEVPADERSPGEDAAAQELDDLYLDGLAAFYTERWDDAIALFRQILARRRDHRDAAQKLEQARTEQQLARLVDEVRGLYRAGQWDAVVAADEKLAELDRDRADPDGLVSSARAQRAAAQDARTLTGSYRQALALIDARRWEEAVAALEAIRAIDSGYRDSIELLARARREVERSPEAGSAGTGPTAVGSEPGSAAPLGDSREELLSSVAGLLRAWMHKRTTEEDRQRDDLFLRQAGIAEVTDAIRRAHAAGDWARVAEAGQRLARLAPGTDPDGLVADARRRHRAAEKARLLADNHRLALQHLDAGELEAARRQLRAVARTDPTYRDTRTLLERISGSASEEPLGRAYVAARIDVGQWVTSLALSPDGRRVATGSRRRVRVWDCADVHAEIRLVWQQQVGGWLDDVLAVAFSPDGRRLATAGQDSTPRIWDATDGTEGISVSHGNHVHGVAFSPDGRRFATASLDRSARVWDATDATELLVLPHDNNGVYGVAFSPDGRRLATASSDNRARVWDATHGTELLTITHGATVYGVAFSPDGRRVATAAADNTARVWDATHGAGQLTIAHDNAVAAVAFSPDGRRLATAAADNTARVWDAIDGTELLTIAHKSTVSGVAFSPDGRRLATASWDKTVQIWHLPGE